ncbi:MAG TPA: GNVR domain-containing protein, partial [Candidatus Eisenbacteria bacterium]|nr:GNVR domain-containing protein [Candidatus Eisenbacteria bacterium]
GCVLGGILLAAALNEFSTPVYRSSVRVEVQREQGRSPLTGAVTDNQTPQADNQALLTAAELVTSRIPMTQVVATLDAKGTVLRPPQRLPILGDRFTRNEPDFASVSDKVDWLLGRVTVEPLRDTRLIRISVENPQPKVAADIANTIAENFVRYSWSQRTAADNGMVAYLRVQAEDVKRKIEGLEQQTGSAARPGPYELDAKIQQLTATSAELNASYGKTTAERLALSSQLDQVQRVAKDPAIDPNEIPIRTDALDGLRKDLLASNAELAKAREIYGANHPKMILIRSTNEDLKKSLRTELGSAIANLESQRTILAGRGANLQSAIRQVDAQLRTLNDQSVRYSSVDSDLKSSRELYNLLMSRVHEAEITGQMTGPLVRIVEPASIEPEAVRPRKVMNFTIGILLGILSGAGLALLLESLRRTIRTPKDVEDALQLPVLGVIPKEAIQ